MKLSLPLRLGTNCPWSGSSWILRCQRIICKRGGRSNETPGFGSVVRFVFRRWFVADTSRPDAKGRVRSKCDWDDHSLVIGSAMPGRTWFNRKNTWASTLFAFRRHQHWPRSRCRLAIRRSRSRSLRPRPTDPQAIYKLRKQTVELAFADLKERVHSANSPGGASCGLQRQVGLAVLIHNLLVVHGGSQPTHTGTAAVETPEEIMT